MSTNKQSCLPHDEAQNVTYELTMPYVVAIVK